MNRPLSAREVLVLYSPTSDVSPEGLSRRMALLQPDEQARANRYVFDKDRLNFATGRLIVRSVLAGYAGPSVFNAPFSFNRYGCPTLEGFPGLPPISFNISHATGMVVAAFSEARAIGVDVEKKDRKASTREIARSYFARSEAECFENVSTEQQSETFFAFWTLKEAYIKARGMGLSIPLADFSFDLDSLRISFSPAITDDPESWTFWRAALEPGYALAVASASEPGERLELRLEEFVIAQRV